MESGERGWAVDVGIGIKREYWLGLKPTAQTRAGISSRTSWMTPCIWKERSVGFNIGIISCAASQGSDEDAFQAFPVRVPPITMCCHRPRQPKGFELLSRYVARYTSYWYTLLAWYSKNYNFRARMQRRSTCIRTSSSFPLFFSANYILVFIRLVYHCRHSTANNIPIHWTVVPKPRDDFRGIISTPPATLYKRVF